MTTYHRFNGWVADRLAAGLSSMECFWLLVAIDWVALILQAPSGAQGWLQYLVQSVFQGVALPVLAFVAVREGSATRTLQQETHDAAMAEHDDTQEILRDVKELLAALHAVHPDDEAILLD